MDLGIFELRVFQLVLEAVHHLTKAEPAAATSFLLVRHDEQRDLYRRRTDRGFRVFRVVGYPGGGTGK